MVSIQHKREYLYVKIYNYYLLCYHPTVGLYLFKRKGIERYKKCPVDILSERPAGAWHVVRLSSKKYKEKQIRKTT